MTAFHFRAINAQNETTSGAVEAASSQAAAELLLARGLTPFSIHTPDSSLERSSNSRRTRLQTADVVEFLSQFGMLTRAGLDADRACHFVSNSARSAKVRATAIELRQQLRQGRSLSQALADEKIGFPPFVTALVRAGEASGRLNEGFEYAVAYLEKMNKLRSEATSALLYPALLLFVAMGTISIIISVLVPRLRTIFSDAGKEVPAAAQFVFDTSDFLLHWGWVLLVILIASAVLIRTLLRSSNASIERLKLTSPLLFGGFRLRLESAAIARQLGALLQNGVLIDEALTLTRGSTQNGALQKALDTTRAELREGKRLSDALREKELFPRLFVDLVSVGDEASNLPTVLLRIAEVYEAEVEKQTKRFIALFGPAMTLVLGLIIGFIVYTMLTALMSVNDLAAGG